MVSCAQNQESTATAETQSEASVKEFPWQEITPRDIEGNPIFAEADLAIECKKIYADQFDADKLPLERRQWHEETGTGIHMMYVGEIVNVWKKSAK